jgi:2-polyprenyl-3-methyl-5-hydroxy-6-metoxy-1,4-benzoquinol methylase
MEKHERIALYERTYPGDYGFEAVMVRARQRLVLEVLRKARPGIVVEVGCGIDLLGARVHETGLAVEQWIIVEPAARFHELACSLKMGKTRVDAVRGFLEDSTDAIRRLCLRPPDVVLCSGFLNEVEEPVAVLRAAGSLLGDSGMVHVNVPNAFSLHRRLAKAMGIIESESELTQRNRQLAQYRVFDFASLGAAAASAGFRVVEQGGYFIKPFTHAQMEAMESVLSGEVLDGLWQLGRTLPELAAEIYVNLQAAQ